MRYRPHPARSAQGSGRARPSAAPVQNQNPRKDHTNPMTPLRQKNYSSRQTGIDGKDGGLLGTSGDGSGTGLFREGHNENA